MLKKLIAIAALVSLLVLGGCAQGQTSSSASASPESAVSEAAAGQSAAASSAAAGHSGAVASEASSGNAASSAEAEEPSGVSVSSVESKDSFIISIGETKLVASLSNTKAARALVERLQAGPVTLNLHAYGGFEKVGPLPWSLPASDEQITTQPGDIMLYQGDQITVFIESNSWDYTPLGHIEGATSESLLEVLGEGDVEAVLSL